MKKTLGFALAGALLIAAPAGVIAQAAQPASSNAAESRHEGYYYPKIGSHEAYRARTKPLADSDRRSRLLFVAAMTKEQSEAGYSPRYAIFAKGTEAEKMIIVGLDESSFATIYRARAVMAALSSLARLTPLLKDADLDDVLTFYDIVRLAGFKEITVSDGRKFAHRISLE
jgi:hypothetical protein